MQRSLVLFCTLLVIGQASARAPGAGKRPAPEQTRAEILVVGSFHMGNPGQDVFNMQADDMLAAKRQAEIAEVVKALRRFNPTRIAVERKPGDGRLAAGYREYVAGTRELTRNEIEQLGYRLARELGHEQVYGVDADGEFPYPRLAKYAKATGREQEFETLVGEIGASVKLQDAFLAAHSVLETLSYMNDDARVAESVGIYYRMARFGEPWDWAGADLVADWFRRNMRIHSNIVGLIRSPQERVLVIYGAGHLGWLQHSIAGDPTLRLRKLGEFVR